MVAYTRGIVRIPRATETKGTVIVSTVEPTKSTRVLVTRISCEQSNEAATLTVMNAIGKTTIASADGTANTITLTADPSPAGVTFADADYVAVRKADGSLNTLVVAGLSTLTINLTHTAGDYAAGDEVFYYGPTTYAGHESTPLAASSTVDIEADGGWFVADAMGYPLVLIHSNPAAGAADCSTEGGIAHLIGV